MIHRFSAENFYSIGSKVEVNLESSAKTPTLLDLYVPQQIGNPVTKVAFLGGGNASGKTNILRILAFLRYLLSGDSMRNSVQTLAFVPFLSDDYPIKPTCLSVDFTVGQEGIYTYTIKMNRKQILMETLSRRRKNVERTSVVEIFTRIWDDTRKNYSVIFADKESVVSALPDKNGLADASPRTSLIALFSQFDMADGVLRRIRDYWQQIFSNVMQFGSTEAELSLTSFARSMLAQTYEDTELNEEVSKVLRKFDIGFHKILKDESAGPEQDAVDYRILHIYNEAGRELGLELESNGTKRMIILLRYVVAALHSGTVAVIDELDAFLHPDIVEYIIDMFMSAVKNPHNAQLIFSAHDYTILRELEKQQIFLSERNANGETEIWRLDKMKGIRSDENHYTRYLANYYGGKPKIEM